MKNIIDFYLNIEAYSHHKRIDIYVRLLNFYENKSLIISRRVQLGKYRWNVMESLDNYHSSKCVRWHNSIWKIVSTRWALFENMSEWYVRCSQPTLSTTHSRYLILPLNRILF